MKITTKAHIAILATNFFFAANYSIIKYISPVFVKPFGLNLIRVGCSVLLFWLVWLFGKSPAGIQRKDLGRFALCALTGITINQLLFIKGLTLTTTIHASLLILITPLLISVFAIWFLKEKATPFKALGLILGVGGAVLLILNRETAAIAENYILGDTLILINAVSYTIYFLAVKPLMKNYSPIHVVRWVFTLGIFIMFPFGFAEFQQVQWSQFEIEQVLALSSIVLTGTFLAYYFTAFGIQHLGAGVSGSYIYTQPVFAVIIAVIFLDENLNAQKIAAAFCILLGVFLVSYKHKKSKEENGATEM